MIPKFRAWDKDKKWMVYDIQDAYDGLWSERNNDEINDYYGYVSTFQSFTDEESFNLMQYTGLKDKNGVEIYVGDIVHVLDRLDDPPFEAEGHIVYEQDDCAFEIALGIYRYSLHRTKFVEYEITGNIYENTELLKEQNK